jgi:hypothetical protein
MSQMCGFNITSQCLMQREIQRELNWIDSGKTRRSLFKVRLFSWCIREEGVTTALPFYCFRPNSYYGASEMAERASELEVSNKSNRELVQASKMPKWR